MLFQRLALCAVGGIALHHFQISFAQQEFKRAKLPALKAAGIGQKISKRQERNGGHGFKHIDLRHHGLENFQHARQRACRILQVSLSQKFAEVPSFMNLLLEPQFIHLVNNDEKCFIMLHGFADRLLQRK